MLSAFARVQQDSMAGNLRRASLPNRLSRAPASGHPPRDPFVPHSDCRRRRANREDEQRRRCRRRCGRDRPLLRVLPGRRGLNVAVVERKVPGSGSSTRNGGGVRSQWGTATNIQLSVLSEPNWAEFEERSGSMSDFAGSATCSWPPTRTGSVSSDSRSSSSTASA